jgi:hypothetical protein
MSGGQASVAGPTAVPPGAPLGDGGPAGVVERLHVA